MAEVLKFRLINTGEAENRDVNAALDSAKEEGFETVFVIGEYADGRRATKSNTDIGTALVMMERAKHFLLFEDEDE